MNPPVKSGRDHLPAETGTHGQHILRAVANDADLFESLRQLDADAEQQLGRGFLLKNARAGMLSRLSGRALVRVGDREVAGFLHDDSKRVMLALPGRYKETPLNPLESRTNITLQDIDARGAFHIGPVTYQKLAPNESCVVKLPDGRFSIETESFLACCLGAPLHVGTVFRRTGMGMQAALTGARQTVLRAGGSDAGRFVQLAAGHRAIYWRPHQDPVETQAEAAFHLPPDANLRVVRTTGIYETTVMQGLPVLDGSMGFEASYTGQITNARAFTALPYTDIKALVAAEASRILTKQLAGFTTAQLFEGSQVAENFDAGKAARKALVTARNSVATACLQAGVELDNFVLKPKFAGRPAKAAADIGVTHLQTLQERSKQPLLAESHGYAMAAGHRAGELGNLQAEQQRQRAEILKDTPASRRADTIADKAVAYPAWSRTIDLSQLHAAIARTEE